MLSKSYRKIWLLITGILLMNSILLNAQDEKLKAIFIYNFTRYIGWPEKSGNFVIVVLGKSSIQAELADIATKKKVGNATIEVKTVNTPAEIADCQIVFVTAGKNALLSELLPKSKEKGMLVVTEKENSCKNGSGINFIDKEGKLSFEICKTNLAGCGLAVSTTFLAMGTAVGE